MDLNAWLFCFFGFRKRKVFFSSLPLLVGLTCLRWAEDMRQARARTTAGFFHDLHPPPSQLVLLLDRSGS